MKIFIDGMKTMLLRDDIRFMFKSFRKLDEKERLVLYHRFGLNHGKRLTLDETSKLLNLTRERIRQIQVEALRKLKKEFRDDDPEVKAEQEKNRKIQEKLEKEREQKKWNIMCKKIELEVQQEIKAKMRQYKRPERKLRKDNFFSKLVNSDHFKFINSFEYTEKSTTQFKQLIETGESIDERIRTVVTEIYPDTTFDTIRWSVIGKYLVVDYQPCEDRKYKRIDIYLPYFLAPKENRMKLLNELKELGDCIHPTSIEDLLMTLKLYG